MTIATRGRNHELLWKQQQWCWSPPELFSVTFIYLQNRFTVMLLQGAIYALYEISSFLCYLQTHRLAQEKPLVFLISSVEDGETTNWKLWFCRSLGVCCPGFCYPLCLSSLELASSWNILHFKARKIGRKRKCEIFMRCERFPNASLKACFFFLSSQIGDHQ